MAAQGRKDKGIFFYFRLVVSCPGLYNRRIIREGPLSRGQVKNSSIVRLNGSRLVSWGYFDTLTSKKLTSKRHR
jgi:hypothetical protein